LNSVSRRRLTDKGDSLAANGLAPYSLDMEDASQSPGQTSPLVCGRCGMQVDIAHRTPAQCTHCGAEIIINAAADPEPAGEIRIDADDEYQTDPEAAEEDDEDELSSLRIRQVSALRRGAYRARSYCVVILSGLLFSAVELAMMTLHNMRAGGERFLSAIYLAAGTLALIFSWKLFGRIVELTRELKQPLLTDPLEPPDFSTLSDGSQHARHLAEMHEPGDDPERHEPATDDPK
jgi:hypothetical protein